jgi:hypothetical protein
MPFGPKLGWRVWFRVTVHEHPVALTLSGIVCAGAVGAVVVIPSHVSAENATAAGARVPVQTSEAVAVRETSAPASTTTTAPEAPAEFDSATAASATDPFISLPPTTVAAPASAVTQQAAAPVATVTVTAPAAAPAAVTTVAPAAPVPVGRTLSLNDACTTTLTHVAATIEAVTYTIRRGDSVNQGHSLGWRIVELQAASDTTVDLDLAGLIPSVTNDVASIRDQMLAGTPGTSIKIDQLSADTDRVSDFCSVRLDPLAGG